MQVDIPEGYSSERFLFQKVFIPKKFILKGNYSEKGFCCCFFVLFCFCLVVVVVVVFVFVFVLLCFYPEGTLFRNSE